MNEIQIELTKLIGKKGSWNGFTQISPATLSDFHRYANDKHLTWEQDSYYIHINPFYFEEGNGYGTEIIYDSSKTLMEQSEECLKQIISLIKSYEAQIPRI